MREKSEKWKKNPRRERSLRGRISCVLVRQLQRFERIFGLVKDELQLRQCILQPLDARRQIDRQRGDLLARVLIARTGVVTQRAHMRLKPPGPRGGILLSQRGAAIGRQLAVRLRFGRLCLRFCVILRRFFRGNTLQQLQRLFRRLLPRLLFGGQCRFRRVQRSLQLADFFCQCVLFCGERPVFRAELRKLVLQLPQLLLVFDGDGLYIIDNVGAIEPVDRGTESGNVRPGRPPASAFFLMIAQILPKNNREAGLVQIIFRPRKKTS